MVNYKNGKIYKLVNDELNLTYYGSTCNELRKRLYGHKSGAKNKECTSHKLFESGICKIYLVEKVSCEDKMELTKRERFYIENNECVNKYIPRRTDKEYLQDNKEKISQKKKLYNEKNREKLLQKAKDYKEYNKEKISQKQKEYYENNKQIISQKANKFYENNKDKILQKKKLYYQIKKAQQKKQVYDFLTQIENSN